MSLQKLPQELLFYILKWLEPGDVFDLSQTKLFYLAAYSIYKQYPERALGALHLAARNGTSGLTQQIQIRSILKRLGETAFGDKHCTPLALAVEHGQLAFARLCLMVVQGIVNLPESSSPLTRAAENSNVEMVKLLMNTNGIKTNIFDHSWGYTALVWAITKGNIEIVKVLVGASASGVDINAPDAVGRTPLWWAADTEQDEILALLLNDKSIQVNVQGHHGETPLSQAAKKGNDKAVALLLKDKSIHVNLADERFSRTPLAWAASRGHSAVVALLISEESIQVNLTDRYGMTPLMLAVERGRDDDRSAVQHLVAAKGVDLNAEDPYHHTALARARTASIANLLLDAGANRCDRHGKPQLKDDSTGVMWT